MKSPALIAARRAFAAAVKAYNRISYENKTAKLAAFEKVNAAAAAVSAARK